MEAVFNYLIAQLINPSSADAQNAARILNTPNPGDIQALISMRMQQQPAFINSMVNDSQDTTERAFAATFQGLDPNLWVDFVTQVRDFVQNPQHQMQMQLQQQQQQLQQQQLQLQMQSQPQPYTMSMALAILNCHGGRPCKHKPRPPIHRKRIDVLTLNYLGSMFGSLEETSNRVAQSIFKDELFNKGYPFIGQAEYDSFPPIWKVVETISRNFKEKVNQLIAPTDFAKKCTTHSHLFKRNQCKFHEQWRAMNDELVSCKLLPHVTKKYVGIFKQVELVYDMPVSLERSFKIVKKFDEKIYTFESDSKSKGHYIKILKIDVTIDGGNVAFHIKENQNLENDHITKSEIIDMLVTPECNLATLVDLTCSGCIDMCDEESRLSEMHNRTRRKYLPAEYSEPGEGGGKSRSKKRGRKSIRRRNKSRRV
jgi:hypothetical protein